MRGGKNGISDKTKAGWSIANGSLASVDALCLLETSIKYFPSEHLERFRYIGGNAALGVGFIGLMVAFGCYELMKNANDK